jgi:hypothetical protein
MANDKVSLWNNNLKFGRSPASGEALVGNGDGFTLTTSNIIYGNPIEFTVPIKVDGQVWSTTTGFKFPDGTVQTTAVTGYTPSSVANNTIQSNVSGGSAVPSANTVTQVLDSTVSNTQGSVIYRNASTWTALAPGTSGQVLTTGGTGANPSWAGSTSSWTTVKKTSTQTITSSTSFVNDSALQFSMVANNTYAIRGTYYLWTIVPGNAGGFRIACNGPTFSQMVASAAYISGTSYTDTYDTVFFNSSAVAKFALPFNIVVSATASGTFAMRIAQNTSNANQSYYLQGSYIEYTIV